MVKSDEHMERVRTKLVEEAQGIKNSEAAKKQRELKKYGKQIQHEKLKQREMDKKSFMDKTAGVKRSELLLHSSNPRLRSSALDLQSCSIETRAVVLTRKNARKAPSSARTTNSASRSKQRTTAHPAAAHQAAEAVGEAPAAAGEAARCLDRHAMPSTAWAVAASGQRRTPGRARMTFLAGAAAAVDGAEDAVAEEAPGADAAVGEVEVVVGVVGVAVEVVASAPVRAGDRAVDHDYEYDVCMYRILWAGRYKVSNSVLALSATRCCKKPHQAE
jgi:hypothetical protein